MITTSVIDPQRFRNALGHYASGITVITSLLDGEPIGFTCQSFYSVSVTPPLVSFSVMERSLSYPKIRQAGRFAVNILCEDQMDLANQFAQRGADKWCGVPWKPSPLGNPVILGSLQWIDCQIHAEYPVGDHLMVIGEVKAIDLQGTVDTPPLLYFNGRYASLAAHHCIE